MSEVAPEMSLNTPMMRQFLEIKKQYPDDILFFRMGDFYEMFLEDAIYAAGVLDIALTRRQDKVPMCGVPHHSMHQYVHPILNQGKRIAICEQLEDPATVHGRIVRRGVTRILTPGSLYEEGLIDAKESRRLAGVVAMEQSGMFQIAVLDLSSAQIFFDQKTVEEFGELQATFNIQEWIFLEKQFSFIDESRLVQYRRYPVHEENFQFRVLKDALQTFNLDVWELEVAEKSALTLALAYFREISPMHRVLWSSPVREYRKRTMILDEATLRTLEITSGAEGKFAPSLLRTLQRTTTNAGARLMQLWLARPACDLEEIERRHESVASLLKFQSYRELLTKELKNTCDLERVLNHLQNNGQVRHLGQIRDTLHALSQIREIILNNKIEPFASFDWANQTEDVKKMRASLDAALLSENLPPVLDARRFVSVGYMPQLDELISLNENAVSYLAQYEAREKEKWQITTLKVKQNNVLGFFIEISKGQIEKAPSHFIRRQTLTNGERYTTEELKELEQKILSATDEVTQLQKSIFNDLRAQVLEQTADLQQWASRLARLDALLSFANCAFENQYHRPHMHTGTELSALSVRHPVIEASFRSELFIPNDIMLDNNEKHLAIITGPNMAGKSTFIRQIGLLQIMAQAGSFVAAKEARLPVVDRIFTRIGAQDRLARGESTFFVEMSECARIFRNYTKNSLILLDEVGRGTSTYDGISIAQAMIESLNDETRGRPKTLFATHYSELATLIDEETGIFGLTVSVLEKDGRIVFLRKIKPGVADKSYGIHVAEMAGMPKAIVDRAFVLLQALENQNPLVSVKPEPSNPEKSSKKDDSNQKLLF